MQRHHATTKLFLAFGALLLAVSLTPFCLAQNTPPAPQLYWVTVTQVKPGMAEQYQAFIKNETLPAFKKAGGKQFETWVVQYFGAVGEVWTFRPVENFKQLDEPNFVVKALGEAGARAWAAKRAQLTTGYRSFLASIAPELSVPLKGEPKLALAVTTAITPGRVAEYAKHLKENALAANAKTNSKGVATFVEGLGGNPNAVHVAVYFDNFEDIGNFVQAYGKAMAELKLQANPPIGVQERVEFGVYRYIPELSIRPAPAKAAGQ
ncbi:MAG: hypothetical protein HY011_36280 [Acidobacteria bacterium]|nr:hypothetical protein [Acidobacteriota bacterium]